MIDAVEARAVAMETTASQVLEYIEAQVISEAKQGNTSVTVNILDLVDNTALVGVDMIVEEELREAGYDLFHEGEELVIEF